MSNLTIDFLKHILGEINFLLENASELKYMEFKKSEIQKRAFVRSLEVIGEAVKNLPDNLYQNHPEIDFKGAARMRDRLIHGYFDIDYSIVWQVIQDDIPILREQIINLIHDLET